ncbi:MAG: hypothetical protein JSS14_22230 [Proteobacteria bacterium]|nr:hypothetical protein [Pseudomonadota bacterium]
MARTPKQAPVLTPAEKKAKKADLKVALKVINDEHAKYVSDSKAADKALKDLLKEQAKAVNAQSKVVNDAAKKLAKATEAAEKGRAKIQAQLADLEPAKDPVNAAV